MLNAFFDLFPLEVLDTIIFGMWILSFLYVIYLIARPPKLRKWGKYLISFLIFLIVQFFNFNGTMYAITLPNYDDSAGDMFVPLLLILPTLLLVFWGTIRVIYLISKKLFVVLKM